MSYNPTFPLHDSTLSSLYYPTINPSNPAQQRLASPSGSTDAPQGGADRDPFSSHASPTPGHFTPLSGSRRSSAVPSGWPTSAKSTPLSYGTDMGQFSSLNSLSSAPGAPSAFANDQTSIGAFPGLQGYLPGGLGGIQTTGTPEISKQGLQGNYLGAGTANLGLFSGSSSILNGVHGGSISRSGSTTPAIPSAVSGSLREAASQTSSVGPSTVQSPQGASAAPGFGAPRPPSISSPYTTNWTYIDLSNTLQGPFPGSQMAEWVAYFTDTVLLKREQDQQFVSFGALKEATGNINPFMVPVSDEMWSALVRAAVSDTVNEGVVPPPAVAPTANRKPTESRSSDLAPGTPETDKSRSVESSLADLKLSQGQAVPARKPSPVSYSKLAASSSNSGHENVHDSYPVLDESSFQKKPQSSTLPKEDSTAKQQASPATPASQLQAKPARNDTATQDPWRKPSLPAVSLAELKQKEMEKLKKLNESPGPRKVQAKSWTQVPLGDDAPHSPATPGSATSSTPVGWNRAATPVNAPKSLAEIQKEAQAKKVQSKPTYSSVAQAGNASAQAHSAPSAAASSPYNGRFSAFNETVRTKQASQAASTPRSTRPQAATKPVSVTAAANQAKPTDELIHWAKISFKGLSKDVNPMELLDVFLSLPANNEAKEFIAESIYSYSKTLDGRRFAHDFLSRKKQAEQSMKPGETWQDVLKRFNPTVEQDPSFKVVTSKRVKPLTRPEGMRA